MFSTQSDNCIPGYPYFWHYILNPFPNNLSKLKEFADYNFNFVENGRKLFKQVENTVGKGEIACYKLVGAFVDSKF